MAAWLAANGGPVQTVPPTAAEWMPADAATLPAVPGAGVAGDVASSEAASSAEAIVAAAAGLPTLTGSAAQSAPGSVAAGSARASSPTQATDNVSFLPETAGSLALPSTDADLSTPVAEQPDTASVNGRFSPSTPTSDSTSMSARLEVAPADAARVTVASAGTDAARRAPAAVATSASANNPVSSAQPASEGERPVTEFPGEGMRLVEGREPREAALPVGARFAESGGATSAQTERPVTGLAKIAAQYQRAQDNGNEPAYAGEKKAQVTGKQSVDTSDPGLGINVAKPDGAMKNFAASPALAPALPERGAEAVAPVVAAPTVSAGEERTLFSADVAHVVRRSVESA
ncbi:MAG TPA: hypothetical protein VNR00_19340, partial [Opitutus sp.]|nr:hypothetical protein [Opitutus sp.]